MKVVVYGGGGALAQTVIRHYLDQDDKVIAVCRNTVPANHDDEPGLVCWADSALAHSPPDWPFDVLVVMPGKVINNRIENLSNFAWEESVKSNLTAPFNALRVFLPRMKPGGRVVVVGSIVGETGGHGCSNYAATKAGLKGLVRAAANEYCKVPVYVNLLELGYVDAGMGAALSPETKERVLKTIPLGRFATTEEFLHGVKFLAETSYMSGQTLQLTGGLR